MDNRGLRTILTLAIAILLGGCSCNENEAVTYKKINGKKILICDIDKITETIELKISEFVESSTLIRLEKDTSAFIGNTFLRSTSNGYIFLGDTHNRLLVFDDQGSFVRLVKPGRGPGEFVVPRNPQVIENKIFVQDGIRGKLLQYSLEDEKISMTLDIVKTSGASIVTENNRIVSAGNSTSSDDPYLVNIQDLSGNIIHSIESKYQFALRQSLVQERTIIYPWKKGLNIHFGANDTLMHYNPEYNSLDPVAVFYSSSHIEINRKHFKERARTVVDIDESLMRPVTVVPEYETSEYYFLSVYSYGARMEEGLPWYIAKRKLCMLCKTTNEIFYVNLVDDFWGNRHFSFPGSSQSWSGDIIVDYPALILKKRLTKLLSDSGNELDEEHRKKLQIVIDETKDDDNDVVFWYKLK